MPQLCDYCKRQLHSDRCEGCGAYSSTYVELAELPAIIDIDSAIDTELEAINAAVEAISGVY